MNAVSSATMGFNAAGACGASSSADLADRMLDRLMNRLDEEGKGSDDLRSQLEQAIDSATESAEASGASRHEVMQKVRTAVDEVLKQNGIDPPTPPDRPPVEASAIAASSDQQSVFERLLALLGIGGQQAEQAGAADDSVINIEQTTAGSINLLA